MKEPIETEMLERCPNRLMWQCPYCSKKHQTKGICQRHIDRNHK